LLRSVNRRYARKTRHMTNVFREKSIFILVFLKKINVVCRVFCFIHNSNTLIWLERNKIIFEGKVVNSKEVIYSIKRLSRVLFVIQDDRDKYFVFFIGQIALYLVFKVYDNPLLWWILSIFYIRFFL